MKIKLEITNREITSMINIFVVSLCTIRLLNVYGKEQISLVNINVTESSTLQCNMRCVANPECAAYTLQHIGNNSKEVNTKVCSLQRYKRDTDAADRLFIPVANDVTMLMVRNGANIYIANKIERALLTPEVTRKATTEANASTKMTTMAMTSMAMPTLDNYKCTAIDELGNDKYIFYWAPTGVTKAGAKFTVVRKDDLNSKLQEGELSHVLDQFNGYAVYSAFTIDNNTYFRIDTSWMTYAITTTSDGLLLKGTKLKGSISNPALNIHPKSSTVIGNDSILFKNDSSVLCFHKAVIDGSQIQTPPPNSDCVHILNIIKNNPTLMESSSILGHDNYTLRFLSTDLYRL